jgi:hypothetical protein
VEGGSYSRAIYIYRASTYNKIFILFVIRFKK